AGKRKRAVFPTFHMGILTDMGQSVQRCGKGRNDYNRRPAMAPPTEIIVTARDSWSPTAPPPSGRKVPGQVQVQVQVQASPPWARASARPGPRPPAAPDG